MGVCEDVLEEEVRLAAVLHGEESIPNIISLLSCFYKKQ